MSRPAAAVPFTPAAVTDRIRKSLSETSESTESVDEFHSDKDPCDLQQELLIDPDTAGGR